MSSRPTALIADDEPILREALQRQLAQAWPELHIVAQARNGREAIELFQSHRPDICFLDVQMPGVSGVDAANSIGAAAHIVFVTAFDHYAVEAFAQGVLDYLLKPVDAPRLAQTVTRLQQRLNAKQPALNTELLLQQLAAQLQKPPPAPLRWLRAQTGQTLRLIQVDDIAYFRADAKYTQVACRNELEATIRTPLKDLAAQLDQSQFTQIHRAYIVNLQAISHITRDDNETATIHLKGRKEVLPVSRNYLQQFRQM